MQLQLERIYAGPSGEGGHASRSRQQEILPQWGTAGGGREVVSRGGDEMKGELAMHQTQTLRPG